jgi:hypothetical protein
VEASSLHLPHFFCLLTLSIKREKLTAHILPLSFRCPLLHLVDQLTHDLKELL